MRYCTSDCEKTVLQRLGIALGILEWVQDFEKRGQRPVPDAVSTKRMIHKSEPKTAAKNDKEEVTEPAALPAAENEVKDVAHLEATSLYYVHYFPSLQESANFDGAVEEAAQVELDEETKKEEDVSIGSPQPHEVEDENGDSETHATIRSGESDSAIESSVDDGDLAESSVDAYADDGIVLLCLKNDRVTTLPFQYRGRGRRRV